MKNLILILISILHLSCVQKTHELDNELLTNEDSTNKILDEKSEKDQNINVEFNVFDSTEYSIDWIEDFKENHKDYNSVFLKNDTIIIDNDSIHYIVLPTILPLNKKITYNKIENSIIHYLDITRINYSSIKYLYYTDNDKNVDTVIQGQADISPSFYLGAEGVFEDKHGNSHGMNIYSENPDSNCITEIYVGNDNIEQSVFTNFCNNGRAMIEIANLKLK